MSKRSIVWAMILAVALWAPLHAFAEDTVESIEKDVMAKWDKLTSMSAVIAGSGDVKVSPTAPTPLHLVGSGSLDFLKKDGRTFSRIELGAGLAPQAKPLGRVLAGSDGVAAYLETEFMGKVESKTVEQLPIAADAKGLFSVMHEHLNLSAAPSEKVNDQEAYVIAGTGKDTDKNVPISKILAYFSKETGVILKVVALDLQGQPMATLATQDIKLNQPIPEEKFRYTPPAAPAPKAEAAPAATDTKATPAASKDTKAAPAAPKK